LPGLPTGNPVSTPLSSVRSRTSNGKSPSSTNARLTSVAQRLYSGDVATKPLYYYENFDRFFSENSFVPKAILEVGVYKGESTKVLATAYPEAKIVAGDIELQDIDFSSFPNVSYVKLDQSDPAELQDVIQNEFPDGIDLVIEDASHIGALSHITFHAVFPFLKKNGIYIIEDWGTGYWDRWSDGGRFQSFPLAFYDGTLPRRIPSHDFGMVGFVKSLVDLTHEGAIGNHQGSACEGKSRVRRLEFGEGFCIVLKA
jgi:hypothetical protein